MNPPVPNHIIRALYTIVAQKMGVGVPLKRLQRKKRWGNDVSGSFRWTYKTRERLPEDAHNLRIALTVGPATPFYRVVALVIHEVCHAKFGTEGEGHGPRWKALFAQTVNDWYDGSVNPHRPHAVVHRDCEKTIRYSLERRYR